MLNRQRSRSWTLAARGALDQHGSLICNLYSISSSRLRAAEGHAGCENRRRARGLKCAARF